MFIYNIMYFGGFIMIGAISLLAGELLYEAARFIIMIVLLVAAVFVGGKLRMASDAKKEAKKAKEDVNITE